MGKRHKHAELIKAWADGAEIEYRFDDNDWSPNNNPDWNDLDYEYRIKPEPKPDVVHTTRIVRHTRYPNEAVQFAIGKPNITFVFDGETSELKSAEVIHG